MNDGITEGISEDQVTLHSRTEEMGRIVVIVGREKFQSNVARLPTLYDTLLQKGDRLSLIKLRELVQAVQKLLE